MSEDIDKQQNKEFVRKRLDEYMDSLSNHSIHAAPQEGVTYRCPCCGYKTLDERGGYDICPVYFWEDDGQDKDDADTFHSFSPNHMSLTQGRKNYQTFGACDEKMLTHVRLPLPEEK